MEKPKNRLNYDPALIRRLTRLVGWTRCVLYWEQIWPRLWFFLIFTSLFLLAVLFDLFRFLPRPLHFGVLIVFILLTGYLLFRAFQGMIWPTQRAALNRLEKENNLSYQPLNALLDHPATTHRNTQSETIWLVHQNRMIPALRNLKRPWPRSFLYIKDAYSLRALLIIFLILGGIEARFDMGQRFIRALIPAHSHDLSENWTLQIWITPPPYSGLGSRYLTYDAHPGAVDLSETIPLLQHSNILLRLENYKQANSAPPTFSNGMYDTPFQNLSFDTFNYETAFDQGNKLVIKQDDTLLWERPVSLQPDLPPTLSIQQQQDRSGRGWLRLSFQAEDDLGLKEIGVSIRKADDPYAPPIHLNRQVSGKKATGLLSRNLAAHPWAGQKIIITPNAIDTFGQNSHGHAIKTVLPQRRFRHPVALRLITIRRDLYTPNAEDRIFGQFGLRRILSEPDLFGGSPSIYFALRVASQRLNHYTSDLEVARIRDILWNVALRLDEGVAGNKRDHLEDLVQQMQDMMERSADKGAMENLFEQMQQSLDQYLQKMMETARPLENFQEITAQTDTEMIARDQMLDMLKQARELMRQGDLEGARAMMQQFQSILSRLAQQPKPDPKQMQQAQETMDGLRNLRTDQQNLMDRTFQRIRHQDRPSLSSTQQAIKEAQEQKELAERLRQQLDALDKMSLKPSEKLKQALQNMEQANRSLERGRDENALQAQMRALDQLSNGLEESARTMAQQMGLMPPPAQMPGTDPLGRKRGGRMVTPDGDTLPEERQIHRSREILQELYHRAGQKGRDQQELEYIDRLLDRF